MIILRIWRRIPLGRIRSTGSIVRRLSKCRGRRSSVHVVHMPHGWSQVSKSEPSQIQDNTMICWGSRSHRVYCQKALGMVNRVGGGRAIANVLLGLLGWLLVVEVLVLGPPARVVVHEEEVILRVTQACATRESHRLCVTGQADFVGGPVGPDPARR